MIETVDPELLKTVSELTHILRWEDDGGAAFEGDNPIPQVAETNTPRSMDVAGECLLLGERSVILFCFFPLPKNSKEARK
jgi:hypothetical protein